MLKIENTVTPSAEWWIAVIRGVRNPYNSWDKMDTSIVTTVEEYTQTPGNVVTSRTAKKEFIIGEADLALMKRLAKAGDDHGKFLRMIPVVCDITAPLYWWKEMDTYKVGTVADSCSTMHTIANKEFTIDDFSTERLFDDLPESVSVKFRSQNNMLFSFKDKSPRELFELGQLPYLNAWREVFLETKDKDAWWQLIQLLPSSYNQKRTWNGNYQVLYHIYRARNKHRLDEWETMRQFIRTLPYSEIITGEENA